MMTLHCSCKNCVCHFSTVDFPEFEYGLRLLRSRSGKHLAAVDTFADPVFDEVRLLVNQLVPGQPWQRVVPCFEKVFSSVCDPAPDGTQFQLGAPPICPRCGSQGVNVVDGVPLTSENVDCPNVTHAAWEQMSGHQRRQQVMHQLMVLGCI